MGGNAEGCSLFREVTVGGTIADVVVVIPRKKHSPLSTRPLSAAESVVLATVRRRGSVSISELVAETGLNGSTEKTASSLLKLGLLSGARDGSLSPVKSWGKDRLVAVEAKLVRWREALDQAVAYRSYADEAYVALPEAFARPAKRDAQKFRDAGVGLLIVSAMGIRTAIAPTTSEVHDWRREFVYSRLSLRGEARDSSRTARCRPSGTPA